MLRQVGVPMQFDAQQGCYAIAGQYYLPPTNFTPEEALALIVLCEELGDETRLPFFAPARRAAIKLESGLPPRLRDYLRKVSPAVGIALAPQAVLSGQDAVFAGLLDAIARRKCVRIQYDSFTERELISTRLSPYRVLFSRRSWYCIGRSSLHRSVRTFNLGRIRSLERLDEPFPVPAGFRLQRYLRNAWHLIPERGPDQRVHVRFGPLVGRNVAEVLWHKTQRTELRADGSLDFHVTVSGLQEISWWILGYGAQAEVIAPARLREIIAQHAQQLARQYAAPSTPAAAEGLE